MALTRKQRDSGMDEKMNGSPNANDLPHSDKYGQRQQRNGHPLSSSTAKPRTQDGDNA
jgi:hypothetical protein